MTLLSLLAIFVVALQGGQASTPPQTTRVEGTVGKAGTGESLSNAQVTLLRSTKQPGGQTVPISVLTDAEGRFTIKDVAPGTYRAFAVRNGYVAQEYGQRIAGREGTVIEALPNQTLRNIDFRLSPAGTITGRVLTALGEPMPRMDVQLLRSIYDETGNRQMTQVTSDVTDDRGEYRLFWIPPGRYYMRTMPPESVVDQLVSIPSFMGAAVFAEGAMASVVSQFNSNSVVVNTGYAPTYYPATSDPRRATAVEVKSGTELTSIDIRMDGQQGSSRLRGRIVDSKTGQPARNVTIMLVPRDLDADDDPKTGTYNPTDGTFEFTNVAPGPYFMVAMGGSFMGFLATLMGEGAGTPGAAFPNFATPDTGQLSLDVRGDMDDIVLKTSSAFTISGIVTASGLGSISALPGFGQIRVRLGGDTDSMMGGMFARPSAIAADGTFTITVTPGTYRIEVTGLPSTVFVKSARLGASDILDGTAVIDESTGGVLQVEIATNPGEIDGRIVDRDQKPLASMQAVLIPEKRSRHDLYKTATSDGDGRFSITGITPGNYTLFVWEDLEPNAHYDPEVLSQYESLGRKLVIGESRKVDVELTPIRMIP